MRDVLGGMPAAFAIAAACLLPGCAIVPQMDTQASVADFARSGKAIVVTSSVEEMTGHLGHVEPTTVNAYVDLDVKTPGPDGMVHNAFTAYGGTRAYLVDPGKYFLTGIYSAASHTSIIFDRFEAPVRFQVAAGDVVYLGQLQLTRILYPKDVACGVALVFRVGHKLPDERDKIEQMLDEKYPGAKERLREQPFKVDGSVFHLKPGFGCLVGH